MEGAIQGTNNNNKKLINYLLKYFLAIKYELTA